MSEPVKQLAKNDWAFTIVAPNGAKLAGSNRTYTRRRNAVAAAKLISSSKLKVVVKK